MLTGIKRLNKMLEGVSKETFLEDMRLQDASAFDISTIVEAARITRLFCAATKYPFVTDSLRELQAK
jgi:hypothetical protein